jgi:predicted ATPase
MRRELPTGTVTFLFTDVEGSTRLLRELGAARYAEELNEHRRIIRNTCGVHGGVEVDTQGDSFFVAFATAPSALDAARELTEALAAGPIKVRVGLHTGTPLVGEEGYIGTDVHRAARIAAAGHGGQVLVSASAATLVETELKDLGEHRLKDLSEPQRLYQLGSSDFLPLKTLNATNLPIVASNLFDREDEISDLVALLADGSRLVTVTGAGGTGKTRVALQVAAELVGRVQDGVFWVPLADLADTALVVPTVAQTLGGSEELSASVRDRDVLLLLDNAEHLLGAAPALAALLAHAPRLRLLVTSRAPLHLSGEREYPLDPLPDPEAVRLFVDRARAFGREVKSDGTVRAICRRLDGLPLAVELAAARTKLLDPTSLLERLERRLPLLTGGPRDAPERQRTLRAAIEWSHSLLEEDARAAFRRFSVFVGGCTLEAAEELCQANLDTLEALGDLSLLKSVGGERLIMLETIREFALEQLEASGDADDLRERHARTFTELAERARSELGGSDRARWEARLETELPNIRAALVYASSTRPELLHRLARALRVFWNTHGYLREGRSWLERSLDAGAQGLERAEILGGVGWICRAMGDWGAAAEAAEERLRLARALDDATNLTAALVLQAVLAEEGGDPARAEELYKTSIAISRSQGERGRPERREGDYAEFLLRQGRYDEAANVFEDCLTAARRRGDQFLVGRYTADTGGLALVDGRPAEALGLFSEGLKILHGFNERYYTLYIFPLLAETFAALGDNEKGARLLGIADVHVEATELLLWREGIRRRDATIAKIRTTLGEEQYAALHAEGAAMKFDEAVEYALES